MGVPKQYTTAQQEDDEYAMNQVAPAPSNEPRVTIIEASPLCSADDPKQDGPCTIPISPKLRATLRSLGMRKEAFSAWETFHVSPAHAMLYLFGSMITLVGSLCYLQVFGVPFTRYYFSIPSMISISALWSYFVAIWRMGPLVARSKLYIYSLPIPWTCSPANLAVCCLGPMANMPFGSFTHFLVVVGVMVFSGTLANKSGMLFIDHPKRPRTSMLKPLLQSVVTTVRFIDNLTDISFIRIVLAQRRDRCMWFGEPGHCQAYKLILPPLILAALGDLVITVAMVALGTEITRNSKRKKRALLIMHVLAFVFELGIVAVTLLSLLSSMRHPDRLASPKAIKEQHEQVVTTVVSLGTTLMTFALTMVGAGDAVQGLKKIGTRISSVGQRVSAAGQRLGVTRQRVSSVGQMSSEAGSITLRSIDASKIDALPEIGSHPKQCIEMSNGGQVGTRSTSIGGQAQEHQ